MIFKVITYHNATGKEIASVEQYKFMFKPVKLKILENYTYSNKSYVRTRRGNYNHPISQLKLTNCFKTIQFNIHELNEELKIKSKISNSSDQNVGFEI